MEKRREEKDTEGYWGRFNRWHLKPAGDFLSAPDFCSHSELKMYDRHFWMFHSHQLLRGIMYSKYSAR